MSEIRDTAIRAMTASEAWPVVFEAGAAGTLWDAAIAALEAEGFVIMRRINTKSVPLREALERYGHLCVDEGTRPTDPGAAAMREGEL